MKLATPSKNQLPVLAIIPSTRSTGLNSNNSYFKALVIVPMTVQVPPKTKILAVYV